MKIDQEILAHYPPNGSRAIHNYVQSGVDRFLNPHFSLVTITGCLWIANKGSSSYSLYTDTGNVWVIHCISTDSFLIFLVLL